MSKAADGTVYCDYILCHLVIAPHAPDHLPFEQSDYHVACYIKEMRAQKDATKPAVAA